MTKGSDVLSTLYVELDDRPLQDFFHKLPERKGGAFSSLFDALVRSRPLRKSSSHTKHRIKNRRQVLDAEIEEAKKNATDPTDYQSVWIELKKLALQERGPFSAAIDAKKGLQYTNSKNEIAYLSKDALRKRMNPRAR